MEILNKFGRIIDYYAEDIASTLIIIVTLVGIMIGVYISECG